MLVWGLVFVFLYWLLGVDICICSICGLYHLFILGIHGGGNIKRRCHIMFVNVHNILCCLYLSIIVYYYI